MFKKKEHELYQSQVKMVVGIDEAGRGSLAGPVSIAAVAFPQNLFTDGIPAELGSIQDSKQLSPTKRELAFTLIQRWAIFAENVYISPRVIDRVNINKATELGVIYLVRRLLQNQNFLQTSPID